MFHLKITGAFDREMSQEKAMPMKIVFNRGAMSETLTQIWSRRFYSHLRRDKFLTCPQAQH